MQSDFGFVIHPVDIDLVPPAFAERRIRSKRMELIHKMFELVQSLKCSHVTVTISLTGQEIEGDLIYMPFLPEQIMSLPADLVLKRVVEAGKVAKELGCKILGLGAYTAFVGRRGMLIQDALKMPVTTGSSYTVAMAVLAALKVSRAVYSADEQSVAIIGATGCLGSVIAKMLAPKVNNLMLIARNQPKLNALREELTSLNPRATINVLNFTEGIRKANVIIVSTNSPGSIIDLKAVSPGTVICDLSQPRNVSQEDAALRDDVLIVDGGLVRPPGPDIRFNFYFGLPEGLAFACMAETMILALEHHYESFSLGGNITVEKVTKITEWGEKHGFQLAESRSFGNVITKNDIARVRSAALKHVNL
jgi:fatty aldehyde-generating acyl-ACP reductase